jgi:hypothetical protein
LKEGLAGRTSNSGGGSLKVGLPGANPIVLESVGGGGGGGSKGLPVVGAGRAMG